MQAEAPEPARRGRVIIADDHELARLGLRTMLEPEPDLEVIGEAVRHLSAHRDSLPSDIPWADIAGMRNVLVHAYFGVDLKIIWHTIVEDLSELRVQFQKLAPLDEG